MKQNLNLYNLIKSLSKTEKGYFRKYAKRHKIGEKNIYLRLFDEIQKIKSAEKYSESFIKEKIKKYSRISNFSVLKSYLYEMILSSMRAYNSGKSTEAIIRNDIEDSIFLSKKNLFAESAVKLNRAKKTSYRHERYDKLNDIINIERLMLKKTEPGNVEKFESLNREIKSNIEKITNRVEFTYLNDITVSNSYKYGMTDFSELNKRYMQILENEILKSEKNAITFQSLIYYYQIQSHSYYINKQYDKALINYKKMIELYESNRFIFKENLKNYLLIFQNCIDMCYILNDEDEYNKFYLKFTDIMNNKSYRLPERQRYQVLSRSYVYELRKLTHDGDFDENNSGIVKLRENFEKNINKFPPDEKILIIYQFATYYFGCGNFNESLKWLNLIINKEEELRQDLRLECRLLFLILHYELGNFDLLEYAVKSTYRYLRKRKTLLGIEPLILYFIRKIGSVSGDEEIKDLFIELKHKMLPYEESLKSFAFNYLAWVESKITGITFPDAVKRIYRWDNRAYVSGKT